MSRIVEEIDSYLGCGSMTDEEYLEHYGMPRRSGRYPWGSGDEPYQHSRDFMGRVDEMRKKGFTYYDKETGKTLTGDKAIATHFGYSTTDFRTVYSIAKDQRRMDDVATAKRLKEKEGMNNSEIGRKMGINESSVRSLLNASSESRMKQARATADFLKERVEKSSHGMIDVGKGVDLELNVSQEKLNQALFMLQAENGYHVYNNRFDQVTNKGQMTTQKVLTKPEIRYKDAYDLSKIDTVKDYITRDGGDSYEKKFHYPESLDSKRVKILYDEDGGTQRDGMTWIRPGVKDLSLGESRYAQVRIMVDGKYYIKGMAAYGDPKIFPPGVDVIVNSNKSKEKGMDKALKKIKDDPDNPFGALIKEGGQYWYNPKTGERCSAKDPNAKLGLINKTREEGEWSAWKDSLPSQFLSKQSKTLAKNQLDLDVANKKEEYAEIMALSNPTIKKYYLNKFAQSCDAAAMNLQAAALPGQKYHVFLPVPSLKDNEVYAPNYKDGTKLAIIRFPHGGQFEIPILTVNNKNKEAIALMSKTASDAIGINQKVAEQLSGADFDGDAGICIPTGNGKVRIQNKKPLSELVSFDNKLEYGGEEKVDANGKKHYYRNGIEYFPPEDKRKQLEMGKVSNLISDMTLLGADDHEIARAVKHSMVVIDAEKHKLDYKASEKDNNIAGLKKKYQGSATGGAATIISAAKSPYRVDKRQGQPRVNLKKNAYRNKDGDIWYDPTRPEGALLYKRADDADYSFEKIDPKTGKVKLYEGTKTTESKKMLETDDAMTLVSPFRNQMELVYAEYANSMKELARKSRVEASNTDKIAYNRDAKKKYASEVESLKAKIEKAELNTARERAANRMAAATVKAKKDAANAKGEDISGKDIKKAGQVALTKYREELGSVSRKDRNIVLTDREWEAIQAGAVSENTLNRILRNSDADSLRQRAMPKETRELNKAKQNRIKAMSASYTIAQIAEKLGVSTSTVTKYLKS